MSVYALHEGTQYEIVEIQTGEWRWSSFANRRESQAELSVNLGGRGPLFAERSFAT